jgi:hypothetical protein
MRTPLLLLLLLLIPGLMLFLAASHNPPAKRRCVALKMAKMRHSGDMLRLIKTRLCVCVCVYVCVCMPPTQSALLTCHPSFSLVTSLA